MRSRMLPLPLPHPRPSVCPSVRPSYLAQRRSREVLACPAFLSASVTERRNCALGWAPSWQRVPAGLPRSFYAAAGSLDSALAVGRHLPVGRFFRWPCGGTTEGAGRAGQLLNALGLWKEALREGHLGPEVHGEPHLGFFAWDGKSPLGNLIDLENSYWNPREVTFGGLVSPGMGGNLPSPAKDFKQSRDRSHGSTCSSQVQGQNARTQPGLVTASREPRPPPPTRNTPLSAWPKTSAGWWGQTHISREWS